MAKFDIKTHEENERRKVSMLKFARLMPSAQTSFLEILCANAKRVDLFQTCITCKHFEVVEPLSKGEEIIERCKLVNARPPAVIIADGCEKYQHRYYHDDDIPF